MNRNNKVIKGIGVVALSGVVATSALTMTSCGKKTSKADSIVITLADGENNGEDCLSSQWIPLSQITTNSDFRESFNTLTHNRTASSEASASTSTSQSAKKEGTIYYTSNPTLATSLKNTAFTNLFDSLDTTTLLSLTSDLYLDLDETTSPDILKAAVINTYFDLFNTKQSQSQNEFNATQRISRVDFISAVVKSTTSPQSNESSLSENEIMSKLSDKSYLGNNNTNNTETGIITKAEAAYMIASCMFNSEMKEVKASKPAENLQACLESGELSSDLKESLEILENKGIISNEFVANWNKALTKSEAVDMIYNGLKVSGLSSEGVVNEDVIADEIAQKAAEEAARAIKEFEAAKTKAKSTISNTNYITADIASNYKEKVDEATSQEEIDSILEEVATVSNNNKTVRRPGGFSVGGSTPVGGGSGTSQPVDEHEGLVYDEEAGRWVTPNHLGERGSDGTTIDWGSAGTLGDNWSHYNN